MKVMKNALVLVLIVLPLLNCKGVESGPNNMRIEDKSNDEKSDEPKCCEHENEQGSLRPETQPEKANLNVESESENISDIFGKIYDEATWGKDENGQGTSGPGSLPEKAKPYLELLQKFIKDNNVRSIVDVGCGDWQLMSQIDLTGVEYLGYDVAKSIVQRNIERFASHNIKFAYTQDATESNLQSADLLIVKEVLQHLPNEKVSAFLKKISSFRHVLIANDMVKMDDSKNNYDIDIGGWRPLDLRAGPFHLQAQELLYYKSNNMIQVLYVNNSHLFDQD